MFGAILIALGAAFLTGYATAVARYGYLRHDVERLRARYRELLNTLAQLEGQLPQADREPLRLLRGGRALSDAPI